MELMSPKERLKHMANMYDAYGYGGISVGGEGTPNYYHDFYKKHKKKGLKKEKIVELWNKIKKDCKKTPGQIFLNLKKGFTQDEALEKVKNMRKKCAVEGGAKKKKKTLTKYNIFFGEKRQKGYTAAEIGDMWKKKKKKNK